MKKLVLVLMLLFSLLATGSSFAAMDPVAESRATVDFWNRPDFFKNHFTQGGKILYGASMQAYIDFWPEQLVKQYGNLQINLLGRGINKSYDWHTAVFQTAVLQREMSNNDYKKMFLLIADVLADDDAKTYGKNAMPAEYFLMFIVNQLGRNATPGGTPLIAYLQAAMKNNPLNKPLDPKRPFTEFYRSLITGDTAEALYILRSVPNSRLNDPLSWHEFQVLQRNNKK